MSSAPSVVRTEWSTAAPLGLAMQGELVWVHFGQRSWMSCVDRTGVEVARVATRGRIRAIDAVSDERLMVLEHYGRDSFQARRRSSRVVTIDRLGVEQAEWTLPDRVVTSAGIDGTDRVFLATKNGVIALARDGSPLANTIDDPVLQRTYLDTRIALEPRDRTAWMIRSDVAYLAAEAVVSWDCPRAVSNQPTAVECTDFAPAADLLWCGYTLERRGGYELRALRAQQGIPTPQRPAASAKVDVRPVLVRGVSDGGACARLADGTFVRVTRDGAIVARLAAPDVKTAPIDFVCSRDGSWLAALYGEPPSGSSGTLVQWRTSSPR